MGGGIGWARGISVRVFKPLPPALCSPTHHGQAPTRCRPPSAHGQRGRPETRVGDNLDADAHENGRGAWSWVIGGSKCADAACDRSCVISLSTIVEVAISIVAVRRLLEPGVGLLVEPNRPQVDPATLPSTRLCPSGASVRRGPSAECVICGWERCATDMLSTWSLKLPLTCWCATSSARCRDATAASNAARTASIDRGICASECSAGATVWIGGRCDSPNLICQIDRWVVPTDDNGALVQLSHVGPRFDVGRGREVGKGQSGKTIFFWFAVEKTRPTP